MVELPFTASDIVFGPVVLYVTVCGPWLFAVAGEAPGPKFQLHLVAAQVDASLKVTELLTTTVVAFATKFALATFTRIYPGFDIVRLPALFSTVNETV